MYKWLHMFKIGYMLKYNRKLHTNWNVF